MSQITSSFITIVGCLIALPILITILKFLVCYLRTGMSPQTASIVERQESIRIGHQRAAEMNAEEEKLRVAKKNNRNVIAKRFELLDLDK
jgi:hypothetical protein